MSDFITPAYFEVFHKPKSVRFDYMNKVTKPFEVLKGGYQIVFKSGKWTQTFGSAAKAKAFSREDRRLHRSEERRGGGHLQRANVAKIKAAEKQARELASLDRSRE